MWVEGFAQRSVWRFCVSSHADYDLRTDAFEEFHVPCSCEALPDLIYLMDNLVDKSGQILIPGINADVAPLLPAEEKLYKEIEFDLKAFQEECGVHQLRCPSKKVCLFEF
jgi:hypothetical protein